jgi:hypothetical protein
VEALDPLFCQPESNLAMPLQRIHTLNARSFIHLHFALFNRRYHQLKGLHSMCYRLVRFTVVMALPYLYLKMYLVGTEARPSDYFLKLLSETSGRRTQAVLFVILLSLAAMNFDAVIALNAIRSLKSPIPLWALSARDMKLILEAPLWLRSWGEFGAVRKEMLHQSETSNRVRSALSFYDSFANDEIGMTNNASEKFVLPGLYWDRLATIAFSEGQVRESLDALHQALQFVPESDPRREELVARYHQTSIILERP